MAYDFCQYLAWIAEQAVPFTATGEFLAAWAALKGVLREDATFATGTAQFTGIAGTIIPAGTQLIANGNLFSTTASWTVGSNTPLVFTAQVAGTASNAPTGTIISLTTPIAGVNSNVTLTSPISGGSPQETDPALQARMFQAYANPPRGGDATDYVEWAEQANAVTRAWCLPLGAGAGTVVIYVMMDTANVSTNGFPTGTGGTATGETRAANATGDLLAVANYIYPLRPVTALVYVESPIPTPINFIIQNPTTASATQQAAVISELTGLFVRIGTPLGTNIFPSQINSAISTALSSASFALISPPGAVSLTTGQIPTLGTITYTGRT